MQPSAILKGILFCILVYCAYTDVRKRKIYNYITVPGIAAGLLLNAWLYPDGGLSSAAAGAAAVLLGGAVFVLRGGAARAEQLLGVDRAAGLYVRHPHADLGLSAPRGGDAPVRVHSARRLSRGRGLYAAKRKYQTEVAPWKRT